MRPASLGAAQESGKVPSGGIVSRSNVHLDTGGAEPLQALPRHPRVRIAHSHHDARNAGGNQGVGAWAGLAGMRAWLEGDVCRGSACRRSGPVQRDRLGMRTASLGGPAAADYVAIA